MFRFLPLFAVLICTLLVSGGLAHAQDAQDTKKGVYYCGSPDGASLPVHSKDWSYCNIYARQFQYREKHIELKKMLEERAENYVVNRRAMLEQYERDLKAYHASLTEE